MKVLSTHPIHDDIVWSISVSGDLIATSSSDGHVLLHQLVNGELLPAGSLPDLNDPNDVKTTTIRRVLFSNGLLLTASFDKCVRIYDGPPARLLTTLSNHGAEVKDVACSLDNTRIVTCSRDRNVWVWRRSTDCTGADCDCDYDIEATLPGHMQDVKTVDCSSDGLLAISGSYDNSLRTWVHCGDWQPAATVRNNSVPATEYAEAPKEEKENAGGSHAHTNTVWGVRIRPEVGASAEAGLVAASVSADGTLRTWAVDRDGEMEFKGVVRAGFPLYTVCWRGRGQVVAAGGADAVIVVDVDENGEIVATRTLNGVSMAEINALAITQDGLVLAGNDAGELIVIDVE